MRFYTEAAVAAVVALISIGSILSISLTPFIIHHHYKDNITVNQTNSSIDSNSTENHADGKDEPSRQVLPMTFHANNSSRKRFILHVGPGKTSTSTLQCALQYGSFENFVYWGKTLRPDILDRFCGTKDLYQQTVTHPPSNSPKFNLLKLADKSLSPGVTRQWWRRLAAALGQSDKSIIFSAEELGARRGVYNYTAKQGYVEPWVDEGTFWRPFVRLLEEKSYDLTIVLTYRRYYEWLRSLEGHVGHASIAVKKWKTHRTTLMGELKQMMENPIPYGHQYLNVLWDEDLANWTEYIQTFNLHDPRGHVQTFVCDILQERPCNYTVKAKANKSSLRDYDLLAIAAHRNGLVGRKTRKEVGNKIHVYHINMTSGDPSIDDFPLLCPASEDLVPLLNRTLEYEARFSNEYSEELLTKQFWDDVRQKKFCSVDVDKVLANETWREIFRSL